ncbi:hypothetical protein ACH5RR_003489 [Cinchona calisaya]|uniref:C3H1-type domain-containing protein n=1 Tax=Cinchona calisaya TaxID=153742 RepID=A0ABD3AUY7_9GENT
MPPKRELCRNFLRGSCQYGEHCKFLHAAQTPSKPNPFGFGMQTGNQFQHTNLQQQKANPFGFGVQNNSQPRGASEFGSKQNQFKAFENKWTRSSQTNASGSAVSRQPDNQPASHKCTDPESCKRQIVEDFENERPLWKLTCYGHSKYGPCDIVGDISYEELRTAAYDDAKRGLSLQSIVERERNLLNSKLVEFDNLLRNPYRGSSNSANDLQSPFPASIQSTTVTAQSSNPPSFSSFNQLGTSFSGGPAPPSNLFGQPHAFQNTSQTSSMFNMSNSPFQNSGFGSQPPSQTLQSPFTTSSASFSNSSLNAVPNPFFSSAVSSQTSNSADGNRHALFSGSNSHLNAVGLSLDNIDLKLNTPEENLDGDNSVWTKVDWSIGEIPEAEPPAKYCSLKFNCLPSFQHRNKLVLGLLEFGKTVLMPLARA